MNVKVTSLKQAFMIKSLNGHTNHRHYATEFTIFNLKHQLTRDWFSKFCLWKSLIKIIKNNVNLKYKYSIKLQL